MPKPRNTDCPYYDAECGIDLTAEQVAHLDAMAACRVDGQLPIPPSLSQRQRIRWQVLLAMIVVVAIYLSSLVAWSEAHEPRPGQARAWMGNTLRHSVLARETGGRR